MLWSDQNTEELKVRWDAGESCSEIAAAMKMTRNAIIGRAHRLELPERRTRLSPQERELAKRRHAEKCIARKRQQRRQIRDVRAEQMQEEIAAMPIYEGSLNIPFADLRDFSNCEPNECRFIAEEPPGPLYLACGTQTPPGEPYCAHCKPITLNRSGLTQAERALFIRMGVRKHLRALRSVA